MGRTTWESGRIVLPGFEFRRIHRSIVAVDAVRLTNLLNDTQRFWRGLNNTEKRDREAYVAAYEKFAWQYTSDTRGYLPTGLRELIRGGASVSGPPARVKRSAMGIPTRRTTVFTTHAGGPTLTFHRRRRTVEWTVPAAYDAVSFARNDRYGHRFFAELDVVRWTAGTGGVFSGNDSDAASAGLSDYCIDAWGPIGSATEPQHTRGFRMTDGTVVEPAGISPSA
ncbi:MAG: hypothetical protein JWQ43_3268 [Glaciihabitans sp.]|nr:hypothetical protein [Glaciihabitans sp.]